MNKKRLGCLSSYAFISVLVTAAVFCVSYLIWGGNLFSPGDLNVSTRGRQLNGASSHAEIGKECSAYHSIPIIQRGMNFNCLECHQDIKTNLKISNTLHGAVFFETSKINCLACHTEHLGPEGQITFYDTHGLPHDLMGYSLSEHQTNIGGAEFVCGDCHVNEYQDFRNSTCEECHSNIDLAYMGEHTAIMGLSCLACHDGQSVFERAFDHNRTQFTLEGEHLMVGCADCHRAPLTLTSFREAEFACSTCHLQDDPHQNQFGSNCEACHTPVGWEIATFDHSMASAANCESCHAEDEPPNHFEGQCSDCHTTSTWEPAAFNHALAAAANCESCHAKDEPANHFAGNQCSDCHSTATWKDATFNHAFYQTSNCIGCHANTAPRNHFAGQCSKCHTTQTWKGATFAHTFPLNHEGANSNCALCHPSAASDSYTTYTCYNCHEHNQEKVAKKHRKEGISNFQNCIQCHSDGRE